MKKHITKIILFCFIYTAFAISIKAAEDDTKVASKGITVLSAKTDHNLITIKIKTHIVDIGSITKERPKIIRVNCTYSKYPCSAVDYIDIYVNGKLIFIPRSVFADLSDLNTAKIAIDKKDFVLFLKKGDASESTVVRINFDSERVKSRTIEAGELPGQLLHETTYHMLITE